MKKLALLVAVAGIVGLSSCGKDGAKKCTKNLGGIKNTVTITADKIKTCVGIACTEAPHSSTQEKLVKNYESLGYTCK